VDWDSAAAKTCSTGEYTVSFTLDGKELPGQNDEIFFTFISKHETDEQEKTLREQKEVVHKTETAIKKVREAKQKWEDDLNEANNRKAKYQQLKSAEEQAIEEARVHNIDAERDDLLHHMDRMRRSEPIKMLCQDPGGTEFMDESRRNRDRMPRNDGLVIQNGHARDEREANAIGYLLARSGLDVVVENQEEHKNLDRYLKGARLPGISRRGIFIWPLALAQRDAWNGSITEEYGQCYLSFRQEPPPGAAYAVNCIQLTAEQLRNKCRQRIWYPKLRDCLIFRDQRSKDEYLQGVQRKRYQLMRCIDLENYDITEKSGRQLSGMSTSSKQVVCRPGSMRPEETDEYLALVNRLQHIDARINFKKEKLMAVKDYQHKIDLAEDDIDGAEESIKRENKKLKGLEDEYKKLKGDSDDRGSVKRSADATFEPRPLSERARKYVSSDTSPHADNQSTPQVQNRVMPNSTYPNHSHQNKRPREDAVGGHNTGVQPLKQARR